MVLANTLEDPAAASFDVRAQSGQIGLAGFTQHAMTAAVVAAVTARSAAAVLAGHPIAGARGARAGIGLAKLTPWAKPAIASAAIMPSQGLVICMLRKRPNAR